MRSFDFVVVGGGIVGMTVARHLAKKGHRRIAILEKEADLGCHASGRNSGVLHSGIYYSADSLKAKVCSAGSQMMQEYALEHKIPMNKSGKVIVAPSEAQVAQIDVLLERARANGIKIEVIDSKTLKEIEPEADGRFGKALYSPNTAVIDTKAVLKTIAGELAQHGVEVLKGQEVLAIDAGQKTLCTRDQTFGFGHLINAAGLHADRVAHWMGVGRKYSILPFKGIYRKLSPQMAARFKGAIYPTPDLRVPFLGVHVTRTVQGDVIVGPTAIPAFGRENYGLIKGWSAKESPVIAWDLLAMLARNPHGFRTLVREEFERYWFPNFLKAVQGLAPSIRDTDFVPYRKVGLRAQLFDRERMRLEMDFVIEKGPASTHILNAVSPAFTGSFAFADWVYQRINS